MLSLASYLAAAATWLALAGAVINRERRLIVFPLVVGFTVGMVSAVMSLPWLLPVVLFSWLWGIGWMVHDNLRSQ